MDGEKIMKKFVIVCLLVAIGAVAAIAKGEARSIQEFCLQNPDLPECAPYVAQQGHPTPMPPPRGTNFAGQPLPPAAQPDQPPPPPPQFNRYGRHLGFGFDHGFAPPFANRCMEFSLRLREQGWRDVRPIRCAGPSYIYSARRDGQRMNILVSPRSGRIRQIIPAY